MKNILTFIIIGFLAIACNPEKKYKTELLNITTQKSTLDSLTLVFKSIDYDSLNYIKEQAANYEKIVKENYNADTINNQFASMMSKMKSVRKSLKSIDKNKKSTEKEITALKKQYSDLEEDIKNGVLSGDQIETFLNNENMALEKFKFNFKAIFMNQSKQKENFYIAQPTVQNFIDLINSK